MRFWIMVAALFVGWCINPKWCDQIGPGFFSVLFAIIVVGLVLDILEFLDRLGAR